MVYQRYRSRFWPTGVPMLFLSPILGGPELTIPSKSVLVSTLDAQLTSTVGHVPFHSKVKQKREYLPVAVSLLGLPGKIFGASNAMLLMLSRS